MMNENWLGLDGQVVIVTGGASGIGKHVVDTLVKVGANAVAVDLNVKTGDELDGAYCVQCNVTDPESVNQMVQAVLEKYGKIDALVNNAGIKNLPRLLVDVKGEKPEYELNEDSFGKMFAVNVKGVFLCAQAVARGLVKQGHGVILNMSSEVSWKRRFSGTVSIFCYKGCCRQLHSFPGQRNLERTMYQLLHVHRGIMEATGLRTTAYNEALAYTRGVKPEDLSTDYSKVIPIGRDGKA